MDDLIDLVAVGHRSFEWRFRKAMHHSVVDYIQWVKVEAAKRSFESTRIREGMFDVGYTDTKAFRELFKKITVLTPVEYRNK